MRPTPHIDLAGGDGARGATNRYCTRLRRRTGVLTKRTRSSADRLHELCGERFDEARRALRRYVVLHDQLNIRLDYIERAGRPPDDEFRRLLRSNWKAMLSASTRVRAACSEGGGASRG